MKTVKEVSRAAGVSVRTLHHYDAIGSLRPTCVTEAGYRLCNENIGKAGGPGTGAFARAAIHPYLNSL